MKTGVPYASVCSVLSAVRCLPQNMSYKEVRPPKMEPAAAFIRVLILPISVGSRLAFEPSG